MEFNITEFIHNAYHYAEGLERFEPRNPVLPAAANGLKAIARDRLHWLDNMFESGTRTFVAGASPQPTSGCMYGWILGLA